MKNKHNMSGANAHQDPHVKRETVTRDEARAGQSIDAACTLRPLSGPFRAGDTSSRLWNVLGLVVGATEDSPPFLYAPLAANGALAADLCSDAYFLGNVKAHLYLLGYRGPKLFSAEIGVQKDNCVVLEFGDEFQDFLRTRFFPGASGAQPG